MRKLLLSFLCAIYATASLAGGGSSGPLPTKLLGDTTSETTPGAGYIGEPQTASASTVAIASTTATTLVSKSLSAGHWACWSGIQTNPAGTTTQAVVGISTSLTTNTANNAPLSASSTAGSYTVGTAVLASTGPTLYNFTSATTVYAVGYVSYAISTLTANASLTCIRQF